MVEIYVHWWKVPVSGIMTSSHSFTCPLPSSPPKAARKEREESREGLEFSGLIFSTPQTSASSHYSHHLGTKSTTHELYGTVRNEIRTHSITAGWEKGSELHKEQSMDMPPFLRL